MCAIGHSWTGGLWRVNAPVVVRIWPFVPLQPFFPYSIRDFRKSCGTNVGLTGAAGFRLKTLHLQGFYGLTKSLLYSLVVPHASLTGTYERL